MQEDDYKDPGEQHIGKDVGDKGSGNQSQTTGSEGGNLVAQTPRQPQGPPTAGNGTDVTVTPPKEEPPKEEPPKKEAPKEGLPKEEPPKNNVQVQREDVVIDDNNGAQPGQQQPGQQQPQSAFDRLKDATRKLWGKMKGYLSTKEGAGESFDGLEILKGDPEDIKEDLVKKGATAKEDYLKLVGEISKTGVSKADSSAGAKTLVDIFRRKQIYKAVVLARTLKNNGGKLGRGRRLVHGADSVYKYVSSGQKAIGGINAGAAALSSNWKDHSVSNWIGLVTNFMGVVDSIKGIAQKFPKIASLWNKTDKYILEGKEDTHIEEGILGIVGVLSDLATMLSKGVALAQSIDKIAGKNNNFFKTDGARMMVILNSHSQITGLGTGGYNLFKSFMSLKTLKGMENSRWEEARKQVENAKQQGNDRAPEQAQAQQQPQEQAQAQQQPQEQGREANQQENDIVQQMEAKTKMKERQELANNLLKSDKISDKVKDKLVLYIALCRKIGRTKQGIAMGGASLLSQGVGLASSIVTGKSISKNTDQETGNPDESLGPKDYLAAAAGFAGGAVAGTQLGLDEYNKRGGEEKENIRNRLWTHFEPLLEDDHGLKGLSGALGGADEDKRKAAVEKANTVLPEYDAADKYFKGAFVDYDALLKSTNIDEFKDLLVTGL